MPYESLPFGPTITYAQNQTAYTTYIGGVAYNSVSNFVLAGSLKIDLAVGRKTQASFAVHTDSNTQFVQFQQVAIVDGSGTLAFSGYIVNPQATKPGFTASLIWSIQCIGQDFLAKKRVYQATHTNKTCGFIANDIFNTLLQVEGAIRGNIYDGPTCGNNLICGTFNVDGNALIPQANFLCKATDALDQLVTQASASGIPYYWGASADKVYDFAPYGATTGPTIDDTQIEQNQNPPTVTWANQNYRNTQWVTGGVAQTATQTESRKGDSNTVSWPMSFDLASAPTVNVDSVAKTVGIKGIDTGKDFYWQQGSPDIVQDSGATKLTSSNTLNVSYIGQFPNTALVSNAAQVAYQASIDGTTGIIEEITSDTTLTTASNALSEGSNLLTRYAQQGGQLQFTTRQSGFLPGQLCPVNMPYLGLANTNMLIETVSITDSIDGFNIWYQVTAIVGPYDVSWVDFFSSLLSQQAPANSGNIGQSTSTSILLSLPASIVPTANINISVYACSLAGNSTLCGNSLIVC
jgi:hypothetical protein